MSLLLILSGDGAAGASVDDELPAWYAYSAVWQLPWLTDNATVDGLDLQEELWNVRVPTIDATTDTGSGSASFNFTASAGGAADGTGSGSASFNVTADGVAILAGTTSGSASFTFTASATSLPEVIFGTPCSGWTFGTHETVFAFGSN